MVEGKERLRLSAIWTCSLRLLVVVGFWRQRLGVVLAQPGRNADDDNDTNGPAGLVGVMAEVLRQLKSSLPG